MKFICGRRLIAAALLFLLYKESSAQVPKELKVGDTLPSLSLDPIYKRSKSLNTRQLIGKFIILDFWNVKCTSCLKAFPDLDSLQKKYSDVLQIVAITLDSRQQLDQLFAKVKVRVPAFPLVYSDKIYNNLFPHVEEPFQVWIDQRGIIRYITAGYNASENQVGEFMKGHPLDMYKPIELEGFDDKKPLLNEAATRLSSYLQYYSLLLHGIEDFTTHFRPSYRVQIDRDSLSSLPYQIKAMNASILALYNIAYNENLYGYDIWTPNLIENNRVIIESKDSAQFFMPVAGDQIDSWRRNHIFSYEMAVPQKSAKECYAIMQADLAHYFPYRASIEKRKVKCFVLRKMGNDALLQSTHPNEPSQYYGDGNHFRMINEPFYPAFIRTLVYSNQFLKEPFIDETSYRMAVDMDINCPLTDLGALKKELHKYGLNLVEEEREINMLVIKDR